MRPSMKQLTPREKEAYYLIVDSQKMIASITTRDLGQKMGYAGPRAPWELVKSLEKKGLVRRHARGQIEVL